MDCRTVINQNAAIGILRSSAIVRVASRMIETVDRAARQSASHAIWSGVTAAWRRSDRATRRRSIGIALVTAVVVHIALLLGQPLPGWRGFVVPAIALAQGLLLLAASQRTASND